MYFVVLVYDFALELAGFPRYYACLGAKNVIPTLSLLTTLNRLEAKFTTSPAVASSTISSQDLL